MKTRIVFSFLVLFQGLVLAAEPAKISARSPEVLATYANAEAFTASLSNVPAHIQRLCKNLLDVQLRMHNETDNWKMWSLYETFEKQNLMTSELQRVATVTELADAIPRYTGFRKAKTALTSASKMPEGSILVADKGMNCGPDPLAIIKGAYFMKCGDYLIGSGLIKTSELKLKSCLKPRLMVNPSL